MNIEVNYKNKKKYIVRYKGKFYGRYVTEEEAEEAFRKACSGVEYEPLARRRYMLPKGVLYMKSMSKHGRPFYCRPQINNKKYFLQLLIISTSHLVDIYALVQQ